MELEKTAIPKRYWGQTLEKLDPDESLVPVFDWLGNAGDHARGDGVGVLLVGPPGIGKTTVASCLGQALLKEKFSVYYITMFAYIKCMLNMMDLKSAWQKYEDFDAYNDWKKLNDLVVGIRNTYDVVILDDVGKEHTTASRYAEDEFDFLLRHRYDLGLPTIPTSNFLPDEWYGMYSDAMASFIHEAFIVIEMQGTDRRK